MSVQSFVPELDELRTRLWRLQESTAANANLDVRAQDVRLVALDGMQRSVLSCAFWLNTYQRLVDMEGQETMLRYAQSNLSVPPQPSERVADMMMHEIRLGLVVFFHFKLDDLLGCLLVKVAPENSGKRLGILAKFTRLSESVGLDDSQQKSDVIKAFSSVRNSLHNNGMHREKSFSVKVGQFDYNFVEDEPVRCASLPHIITLIQSVIDTIQEVLESDKVRDIKEIIPDTFGEWHTV